MQPEMLGKCFACNKKKDKTQQQKGPGEIALWYQFLHFSPSFLLLKPVGIFELVNDIAGSSYNLNWYANITPEQNFFYGVKWGYFERA